MRTQRLTTTIAALLLAGALATAVSAAATAAPAAGCRPGSGRQLAGHHFTDNDVSSLTGLSSGALRCANLTGADFSGVSLSQVDLTAALLRNANLQHADLTQATLSRADLSGANLTGATMIQVTATHANFTGANLSNVDLTQADLTGANLSHANVSGTTFTQATLDGTNFTGATGVIQLSLYLLLATVALFALLVLGTIRRQVRSSGLRRGSGVAISTTRSGPVRLVPALIGTALIAVGFHLLAGSIIGLILTASGPPVAQTCTPGVLCTVGVASDGFGLPVGIILFVVGIIVRASSRRRLVSVAGPFGPGMSGPLGPGSPFTYDTSPGGPSGFGGIADSPPDPGTPTSW